MQLGFSENRKFDVVAIGRVGVDLYTNDFNCPMEDIKSFSPYIGGSPANIMMGAAKLGLKTGFIGKIADDSFARFINKRFTEVGIDTSGLVYDTTGAKTQIAVSEVLSPTDAKVIFYRNDVADLNLEPTDVNEEYIKNAKLLMISGTALAASPSREAVFMAIYYAQKHNTKIMMDIDFRPFTWKSAEETAIYYNLALEKCDIVLGTREEFDAIEAIECPGNQSDEISASRLLEKQGRIIVIKRGRFGSNAFCADGTKAVGHIYPAKIINTFGAGDAYAASFISGLLDDVSVEECMDRGAAAASIVISKNDASDSMPTTEERNEYMRTHKPE